MIVAHLSELHLGFRAFERTERGRNARERDVAAAFDRAVEELVRLRPDLIVVAGDVFDRSDPPPAALLSLTRGLDALRAALPGAPVALVAGARDTPLRDTDDSPLSVLESLPRTAVATRLVTEVDLEALDARLCLVPWAAAVREEGSGDAAPTPSPERRWNVLVAHGAAASSGPGVRIDPRPWSYVALGGEHAYRKLAANAAFAGSLERVGSSPWDEAAEEKGLVSVDLETGRIRFHALPVRPVVALAAVRTPPSGPAGLPDRVREVTREIPGGIQDKIVRLRVRGARQRDLLVLQGALLADLSDRTLHLDVEVEPSAAADGDLPLAGELLAARLGGAPSDVAAAATAMVGESLAAGEEDLASQSPALAAVVVRERPVAPGDGVPCGIVAVVSTEPSAVSRFLREASGTLPASAPPWLDPEHRSPDRLLSALEDELVRLRGGAALQAALGTPDGAEDDAGRRELEERMRELEGAEEELRRLERELRDVRADHAEVAGDLEVATMDWLRERQDAETHLQAYRDRARELKGRLGQIEASGSDAPCPTCGRLLREHYDDVLADLRDEWEAVVQDGSWWRRRREQLDLKPANLQELEGRSLRLQAAVEDCAERVEGSRSRVRERDEARQRLAELGPIAARGADAVEVRATALLRETMAELRERIRDRLLEMGSRFVAGVTGSRVLALTGGGPAAVRLEGLRATLVPTEEDLAAAEVCLRLAGAALGGAEGDVILPTSLVERLREGDRLRLVDRLPSLRGRTRRVLVGMRADTAERRHEALDGIVEVAGGEGEAPAARWLRAGRGRLVLARRGDE